MKHYIPNHPKFDKEVKLPILSFVGLCLFWLVKELIKTLSNEPSFFSSKRIERLMIFLNANIILDICIHELLMNGKVTVETAIAIYVTQMIYVGYQTKQMFTEKKHELDIAKNE